MKQIEIAVMSGPDAGRKERVELGGTLSVGTGGEAGLRLAEESELAGVEFVVHCGAERMYVAATTGRPLVVNGVAAGEAELGVAQIVCAGAVLFMVRTVDIPLTAGQRRLLRWLEAEKRPVYTVWIEGLHDDVVKWLRQYPEMEAAERHEIVVGKWLVRVPARAEIQAAWCSLEQTVFWVSREKGKAVAEFLAKMERIGEEDGSEVSYPYAFAGPVHELLAGRDEAFVREFLGPVEMIATVERSYGHSEESGPVK